MEIAMEIAREQPEEEGEESHLRRGARLGYCVFTHFSSIWWREHCSKHPTDIPTTWDALKVLMRHRFVPSYYARDMLNKL